MHECSPGSGRRQRPGEGTGSVPSMEGGWRGCRGDEGAGRLCGHRFCSARAALWVELSDSLPHGGRSLRRARTDTASRWLPLRPPPAARLRAVNTARLREPARRRPAPGPHQRGPIGCQAQVNHPSPRGRAQTRAGRDLPAAPSSAGVWPGQPSPITPHCCTRAPSSGGRRVPDLRRRAGPLGLS